MTTFAYIARDQAGQRITGRLAAANEQTVLAELHSRQLAPVKVEPVREAQQLRRRVSSRRLARAYQQLADLERAGVPLLRALRLLGRGKSDPRLAEVFTKIADAVADGSPLADAMAMHEEVFPSIQIAMVRAGERGGFLDAVLTRMGQFLEHQAEMRSRVLGNLFYPALLLVVGLVIVIVALVVFVPQFADFYTRMELPLPTKILLAASNVLIHHWFWLLVALAALGGVFMWARRQTEFRRTLAAWSLRIPVFGKLVQGLAVGRFTRILGTLLANGIPMLSAMQISRDAAGNVLLAEAIDDATDAVRAGETLAGPLAESGLFDDDVLEMIAVGESANNLPEVLLNIAQTIEKRVDRILGLLIRLMEPALLMLLGGMVFFIFVALIVPMLQMSRAM